MRFGSWNVCRGWLAKSAEVQQEMVQHGLQVLFLQEIDLRHFSKGMLDFPECDVYVDGGEKKRVASIVKKGTFASPATARAVRVFPVPGGPTSSTP